jgi:mercuric ion binding protein
MKSRKLTVLLVTACMLVMLAGQTALGATRIVKLNVPGCQWPDSEKRARDALQTVKGVKDIESNWFLHWMKVTYDDEVTNVDALIKALNKDGYYIEGQPEMLQ